MTPRWSRNDGVALGGLLLLPLLWYFTPLFTDACYYLGDLIGQYNPWWSYGHEILRAGRIPLWNPFVFGGTPYHVNPENALFYPLKLPLIYFSFFKAAAILRALNAMAASAGAYLLLRSYGTRPVSGVIGALMFSYGSFMAYEFVHIPYVNTAVWFPWQLFFLERLLRRPRPLDALWLAIVTATSFLGGSPGIFFICQLTLGFFLAAGLLRLALAGRWKRLLRFLGLLASAAALVAGLTLVLLLPAMEFVELTPRAGGLENPENFHRFSLIPETLKTLVFPWAHHRYGAPYPPVYPNPFLYVPYLGLGAVLLVLFNLRSRRYARLAPITFSVATVGFLIALGTQARLLPWLMERVAPFGWFRWPHDYMLMGYLVLPIAAATGFDALLRARGSRLRRFGPLTGIYLLAALIVAPWVSTMAVLTAAVVAVSIALALRPSRWPAPYRAAARYLLAGAAVLLLAIDLFAYSFDLRIYLPRDEVRLAHAGKAIDQIRPHPSTGRPAAPNRIAFAAPGGGTYLSGQERVFGHSVPLVGGDRAGGRSLERNRRLTDFDRWLRRVDAPEVAEWLKHRRAAFDDLDDTFWTYPVNASMLFGYQEISGYDPFVSGRVLRLFRTLPFHRTWDLFGVRYVVTPHRVLFDGLELAAETGGLYIWHNRTASPRVSVPARVEDSLAEDEVLRRLGEDAFDPSRVALFEGPLSADSPRGAGEPDPGDTSALPAGTASILGYEPERVRVRAEMSRPGHVVLHDVYHPGWKVFVDGAEAELLRADYVLRAVRVPEGDHELEFLYRPRSFTAAAWISGLCWAGCLLALGFAVLRRPGGKGESW